MFSTQEIKRVLTSYNSELYGLVRRLWRVPLPETTAQEKVRIGWGPSAKCEWNEDSFFTRTVCNLPADPFRERWLLSPL
jgi:hypothetical protein